MKTYLQYICDGEHFSKIFDNKEKADNWLNENNNTKVYSLYDFNEKEVMPLFVEPDPIMDQLFDSWYKFIMEN